VRPVRDRFVVDRAIVGPRTANFQAEPRLVERLPWGIHFRLGDSMELSHCRRTTEAQD
jgi:hypothetical protein